MFRQKPTRRSKPRNRFELTFRRLEPFGEQLGVVERVWTVGELLNARFANRAKSP
jgi:hypothetical protein